EDDRNQESATQPPGPPPTLWLAAALRRKNPVLRLLILFWNSPSDDYDLVLNFLRDLSQALAHQHVDFAADSKLREVQPRLNGKATVGQNLAFVMDFQVIHIRAVGVNFGADGVARAVDKVLPEAGRVNVIARRFIHFPAGNLAAG